MSEILDEIEKENNTTTFSKLSFSIAIITLGLFSYLFLSFPRTIKLSEGIPEPPTIIVTLTQFSCLFGLILMILSFWKNEPKNWFKLIGAILNIILFTIIIASIVFARII